MRKTIILLASALLWACTTPHVINCPIRVNQVGYYPSAEKIAVLESAVTTDEVQLLDSAGVVVWSGEPIREAVSPWSGKVRRIVDFTEVTTPGCYTLRAGSYEQLVTIAHHALNEVAKASMKAFYLQRTGVAIEEQYAGIYARPVGHPDTLVYIHEAALAQSSASHLEADTVISSPYGWYDAGDYNKYIVNSGFAIGTMLIGYESNPEYYNQVLLNLPESGNAVPDFLDEIMFNLRWMVTMQDPEDGGVYHKLTEPAFEGFIRPTECHKPRYVTQKGTAATLDFAANMAMTSRLYAAYPEYADFAADALLKAKAAFAWAEAHPQVYYDQDANNKLFSPQITTGTYGDGDCRDEFFWAATEMYFATADEHYLALAHHYAPEAFSIPSWGGVAGLGVYEWLLQEPESDLALCFAPTFFSALDDRLAEVPSSCFHSPCGNRPSDFGWGCMGEHFAGQGMAMLLAYQMTGDAKYLTAAIEAANYILGCNATGYCFVTGFGSQRVMHPHHRLSASDGIDDPLPGFLAGGPNPGMQDHVPGYPSSQPDEAYLDLEPSYASNEIAINWNAYLVALLWGIEANMQ